MDYEYSQQYFEQYIVCFEIQDVEPSIEAFKEAIDTYINIESMEEFERLVEEILVIKQNNDWDYFVEVAEEYKVDLNEERLREMAELAICFLDDYKRGLQS